MLININKFDYFLKCLTFSFVLVSSVVVTTFSIKLIQLFRDISEYDTYLNISLNLTL